MGTPLFMSPEQWEGAGVDHRTDVYALAILAHNMLTGRYPFETNSHIALMNMHVNGEPKLPSVFGVSASLDEVFAKALAKDKAYRHQSASEFFQALKTAADGAESTGAAPAPAVAAVLGTMDTEYQDEAPTPRAKRRGAAIALAAALGGGALAGAFLLSRDSSDGSAKAPKPSVLEEKRAGETPPHAVTPAATFDERDAAAMPATVPSVDAGAVLSPDAAPKRARQRPRTREATPPRRPDSTTPPKREPKPKPKPEEKKNQWGDTVDPY